MKRFTLLLIGIVIFQGIWAMNDSKPVNLRDKNHLSIIERLQVAIDFTIPEKTKFTPASSLYSKV
ncbi:MAG: hypothetical protein JXR31_16825, partial [Prolixibacteraceae bacterium]|nr:hypothetical protein [Prolixibacteraceae bacterium]